MSPAKLDMCVSPIIIVKSPGVLVDSVPMLVAVLLVLVLEPVTLQQVFSSGLISSLELVAGRICEMIPTILDKSSEIMMSL